MENEKDDPFTVHCIVRRSTDDGPRLSLQNKNREKGRTSSNAFFKMYGQADRTSLAVYVLREGSHDVQWHCL